MIKSKKEKRVKHIVPILLALSLLFSSLHAQEKALILAEGNTWLPMMPKNFVENHKEIKKLPFSGFVMVGNTFTHKVMKPKSKLDYNQVWSELKDLKNLYKEKQIFLKINIHFPADYWDTKAWSNVKENFKIVAKVINDLNLTGIAFDDEVYRDVDRQMINFKFPTYATLNKNSTAWERKGSEKDPTFDEFAYRNPKYTFKEHCDKLTSLFKEIMEAMVKVNPHLTMLVYHGPALSHKNSNRDNQLIVNLGLPRAHELLGPIFTGLKEGVSKDATLYDMGESYRYRRDTHFKNSYQWRKYNIAKDDYNNDLNSSYQWIVPKKDRKSWSKDVHVGFMVFNKGQKSNYKEFDTRNHSTINDIKSTLKKALKYSDRYVIYYCQEQDWLLPNQKYPLKKGWMEMLRELYKDIE
jgi:hypothetical protein